MLVKEEKKVVSYDFMPEAPIDIAYYSADNNDRVSFLCYPAKIPRDTKITLR